MIKRRRFVCWLVLVMVAARSPRSVAESFIVADGKPMAEIVIAESPTRAAKFAAKELRDTIKKMTGAELPIKPPLADNDGKDAKAKTPPVVEELPVKIYVGKSPRTERLGVTDEGLEWGAYRIKSGDDWLVLLGKDKDFKPVGIVGENRGHWMKTASKEWDEATGTHWGNPIGGRMFLKRNRDLGLWSHDEKGTLNAVYGFLKRLGVRWYMPGELGEIVPETKTIPLPEIDETVEPDYKIRMVAYSKYALKRGFDATLWGMRLGVNDPYGYHMHHGIANVTRNQLLRDAHPEYYALYDGKRETRGGTPNACLSNPELFEENLRFVRLMFDMYDIPMVSVWPDDGYTKICQCPLCEGKASATTGLSDHVWDYVNRIAKEVEKTHPDKFICGGAYSSYWWPPEKIDKLNPNVMVSIVNGRRRYDIPAEELKKRREAVLEWGRKTGGKVIVFMNHGGGANTPNIFAEDIKAYKGAAIGEDIWPPFDAGTLANPGFTHLNYYVSAALEWDADQDPDKLLDEYYEKFYGPAAEEMKAFINFYEVNQRKLGPIDTASVLKEALDLFDKAKEKVDPESVYGKRIALFEKGVERYRKRYDQISVGRKNVPSTRVVGPELQMLNMKIDGVLDEIIWRGLHGGLKENETGSNVQYGTRFRIAPRKGFLYVGIRCEEQPGEELNSTTTKNDDPAIWDGDYVDLLFETPNRSYYQISINPAGAVADLDRSVEGDGAFNWDSKALVVSKVDKEKGVWVIEARIPYTSSEQDPLHEIIGSTPHRNLPWFCNICRQRKREDFTERSAFSPTGKDTFHHVVKFGKMVGK